MFSSQIFKNQKQKQKTKKKKKTSSIKKTNFGIIQEPDHLLFRRDFFSFPLFIFFIFKFL